MAQRTAVQIQQSDARPTVQLHLPDGRVLEGQRGLPLGEFLAGLDGDYDPIVGGVVNGELRELTYNIDMESTVRPVTLADSDGMRIYRRSLSPYDRICMHEFVAEGKLEGAPGVRALDIAKRLMDYGIHPPTNYFPLIVHEALMIEPTETESKGSLDCFVEAMQRIAAEARDDPELLKTAPHKTPFGRLDEVQAARQLVLCCRPAELAVTGD
jgi:hypothetical protein